MVFKVGDKVETTWKKGTVIESTDEWVIIKVVSMDPDKFVIFRKVDAIRLNMSLEDMIREYVKKVDKKNK